MIGILRAIGARGENAVRRSLWAFAGAGLIILALGFLAGALVEFLATLMPLYLALGCGAIALFILAAIFFAQVARDKRAAEKSAPAPAHPLAAIGGADWKSALGLALVEEARDKPARAAALAALAGLILGALEGFEDSKANNQS